MNTTTLCGLRAAPVPRPATRHALRAVPAARSVTRQAHER